MNGSKNTLLITILVLALLPWAFLLLLVNSERFDFLPGSEKDNPETAALRQAEAERHENVILGFEEEIRDLKSSLAEMDAKLEEERAEKLDALDKIGRLQNQYNSAQSEVVRLITERMEAIAATPPSEPATEEPDSGPVRDSPSPAPKTPDAGGWILPPPN